MSTIGRNHIENDQETDERKSKSPGKRYRLNLTCVICNGNAHGYNFDAISCESCKAFFRRNALQPSDKFKCRGDGNCNVLFNQKRRCKRCRLDKCLRKGMRKEWILSDKEKREKRIKIEENRRLRQTQDHNQEYQQYAKRLSHTDDSNSDVKNFSPSMIDLTVLSETDWSTIKFLENAYTEAVNLNQTTGISQYPSIQPIESTLELFRIPIYISSIRLITYFKQIPEFQQLHKNDQVYCVKLNTLTISFLHSIYIYDDKKQVYHEQHTNDPLFLEKDWINTIDKSFHNEMKQIQNNLIQIIQSDDKLIKIFFIIILFSNNLYSKDSRTDINTLSIHKAQNIYIDLFYKYCLHHYDLTKSTQLFMLFTNNIMAILRLINELKYTIQDYINITQLSPLMQSLL